MSKVIFVHDGEVYAKNGELWSNIYSNRILYRYRSLGEKIVLIAKPIDSIEIAKANKLDQSIIEFVPINSLKSISGIKNLGRTLKNLENIVVSAERVVVRLPSDLGFLVASICRKRNLNYLTEVVGCPLDSYWNHSSIGKVLAPFYYLLQRKAVKDSRYVIYVTERFLQKRYPNNYSSVSCSDVVLERSDNATLVRRLSRISDMELRKYEIGTIGPLNMKYKGFDRVIHAISFLNKHGYRITYSIVGTGDPKWLKKVVIQHNAQAFVKIIGQMAHGEIYDWLDTLDIYIQPSRTEGMPRSLIEAMSRGCPSIGTNTGGIPELISGKSLIVNSPFSSLYLIYSITKLTKQSLLDAATTNFIRSHDFVSCSTDARRDHFLQLFLDSSQKK